MTRITSGRGPAASALMAAAARPPRVSSAGFARSPASMARGRLAHPRIERVADPAAERAAKAAQAVACDVGAALPSVAAATLGEADGGTGKPAARAALARHAPSAAARTK